MKLHIGCGGKRLDGFINSDIVKTKASDIIMDVTKKFPYPDNSIDEIFTAHMLEHLYKSEAILFLRECQRVLKPKGLLRIDIPILDRIINNWVKAPNDVGLVNFLYGIQSSPPNFHRYGYTKASFEKLLNEHGFELVNMKDGRTGYDKHSYGIMSWSTKV